MHRLEQAFDHEAAPASVPSLKATGESSSEQFQPLRWLLNGLLQTVQYDAGTSQSQSIICSLQAGIVYSYRRICQNVISMPIAISANETVTATDCQKVMTEADHATIVVSPMPKPMSNSAAASQFGR
jgi:hypothetical protein